MKFSYDLFLTTQRETIQGGKGPFIKVSYTDNLNNLEGTQHLIVDIAAIARSIVFSAAESRGFQQKFQTQILVSNRPMYHSSLNRVVYLCATSFLLPYP